MINALIASLIISFVSLSGLFFVTRNAKKWLFSNIKYLVTLSAAVLLMTVLHLAGEAFEIVGKSTAAWSVVGGFMFIWLIESLLPEIHHHHDNDCPECISSKSGVKTLIGDSIHNIADGIILVPAFAISTELGIVVSVGVLVHEFIQEISEFFILQSSGFSTKKAIIYNFFSALTIVVGVFVGSFLVNSVGFQGVLLGASAGVFLQIVAHDLFPFHTIKKVKSWDAWKHILIFIAGILLISSIKFFFHAG